MLSADPKRTDPIRRAGPQPAPGISESCRYLKGTWKLCLQSNVTHKSPRDAGDREAGEEAIVLLLTVDVLEQKHDFAKLNFIACT